MLTFSFSPSAAIAVILGVFSLIIFVYGPHKNLKRKVEDEERRLNDANTQIGLLRLSDEFHLQQIETNKVTHSTEYTGLRHDVQDLGKKIDSFIAKHNDV